MVNLLIYFLDILILWIDIYICLHRIYSLFGFWIFFQVSLAIFYIHLLLFLFCTGRILCILDCDVSHALRTSCRHIDIYISLD